MSRRRFGDAEDTAKDFILAIDDHKQQRARRNVSTSDLNKLRASASEQKLRDQLALPHNINASTSSASHTTPQSSPQTSPIPGPGMQSAMSINYQGSTALGPAESVYRSHREATPLTRGGSSSSRAQAPADVASDSPTDSEPDHEALRRTISGQRRRSLHLYENEPLLTVKEQLASDAALQADITSEHAWLTKRKLDLVIQKKSIWIFLNGMFGLALMCTILQVCWDPSWQLRRYNEDVSVPADYYSDIDWVSHRLSLTPQPLPHSWNWNAVAAECPSPLRSAITESLKLILTLSTLFLCWQILDRKRLQVNIKIREQRRKLKAKGYNLERDKLYMSSLSSASNVSTLGLLAISRTQFRWELWFSLIVCLIQPIPFTHQLTHGFVDDKIGMLMWARMFLMFRVVRDTSEIWLNRRSIKSQSSLSEQVPDFDWWLSLKTICYRSPLTFAGCFYALCIIIFGHSLYLAERERLPIYFNIWTSMFCSFQIVSVGWPADVWEIYMPITILGKMVSMFAAMSGLILISFVIVTVGSALHPSRFEENALNYITMDKVRQKERDSSAALIQYVWKNFQREAELEAKLRPKNPGLYEEISEQEEKQFMDAFIQKSKELRTIRRERAELEERSDPTSVRNISPMDLYFDTKLEAIRTDIKLQKQATNQTLMNITAALNQLLPKTAQPVPTSSSQTKKPRDESLRSSSSSSQQKPHERSVASVIDTQLQQPSNERESTAGSSSVEEGDYQRRSDSLASELSDYPGNQSPETVAREHQRHEADEARFADEAALYHRESHSDIDRNDAS